MRQPITLGAGVCALAIALLPHAATAICTTDASVADFAAGTAGSCYLADTGDGEVLLSPTAGAEFFGVALPAGWGSFTWDLGGTVVVGSGSVTVDAALVRTDLNYGPGRSLEFVATFGAEPFQHVGFGNIADSGSDQTYGGPPWAMFSTGGPGLTTLLKGQPACLTVPVTGLIDCGNWAPSAT